MMKVLNPYLGAIRKQREHGYSQNGSHNEECAEREESQISPIQHNQ